MFHILDAGGTGARAHTHTRKLFWNLYSVSNRDPRHQNFLKLYM